MKILLKTKINSTQKFKYFYFNHYVIINGRAGRQRKRPLSSRNLIFVFDYFSLSIKPELQQ